MKALDKLFTSTGAHGLEFKEEERRRLSSNSVGTRSSSLEFNPNSELVSPDAALDYLAEILVEIYLNSRYADRTKQEGSDLLPGVHKRTG